MKTIQDIKHLKQSILTTDSGTKLNKLEDIVNHKVLSDQLKDSYIIDELKKITSEVNATELFELIEDYEDNFYNDASIEWIYNYIYELFRNDLTINDIDNRLTLVFGYYTNTILAYHDGQFYIFLEY